MTTHFDAINKMLDLRQPKPRTQVIVTMQCYAPDEALGDWVDLPDRMLDLFEASNYRLPCRGSGTIHPSCHICMWSSFDIIENTGATAPLQTDESGIEWS